MPEGATCSVTILKTNENCKIKVELGETKFKKLVIRARQENAKEVQLVFDNKKSQFKGQVAEYCGNVAPKTEVEVIKK